jgi:hypothetical protein
MVNKSELKNNIEYCRLLREFIGTLEGILFWDLDGVLIGMIEKKLSELREKSNQILDDSR